MTANITKKPSNFKKNFEGYIYLAPTFIILTIFVFIPIITSFNLDLYNWVSQLFVFPSWFDFNLSNLLSQFGVISTNSQSIFTTIESLISSNISFIVIKVSLSLIYLSWMIVWLSQQKRFYYFSNYRSKKY